MNLDTVLSSLLSGFKGTVRPDWIFMRVEPLDRHRKGQQPLQVFSFEYLKRLQSSELLHTKMPLIILLVGSTGCMGTNCDLFHQTVLQKCGRVNNCSWDYGLLVEYLKKINTPQSKPKQSSTLGDFFNK